MKKTLLLFTVVFICAAGPIEGQSFGIRGGGNIAMLNNSPVADAVLYFHTGIYLREAIDKRPYHVDRRDFRSKFFFQPELIYSRQGAALPDYDLYVKNDYVNLALMFQYMPVNRLAVEFGPQAGYMVISDVTDKWVGKKNTYSLDNGFRKMDYALCFGLSYRTWSFIDLSCRYNLGLNDIIRNNTGKKVRNGVFQLSLLIDIW